MKSIRPLEILFIVSVLMLGALLFLMSMAWDVDTEKNTRIESLFSELKVQEAHLDYEMLASRSQLSLSYDKLSHAVTRIREVKNEIGRRFSNPMYVSDLELFEQSFYAKIKNVEGFKSHNAVYYNLLKYFPVLVEGYNDVMPAEGYYSTLKSLRVALLEFNLNRNPDHIKYVNGLLSELAEGVSLPIGGKELRNIIQQVGLVLTFHKDVSRFLSTSAEISLSEAVKGIQVKYEGHFLEEKRKAQFYVILLFIFAVLISLATYFLLVSLFRSKSKVAEMLASLEFQRYAVDQHAIVSSTDKVGKMTYVNDLFLKISGYSRDELIGRDHQIVNSGHHEKEFFKGMWADILAGRVWTGVVKNKAKNGKFYWVNTTAVPLLDDEGVPFQYISISTDVTATKLLEEELSTSMRGAQAANVAKSQFLATMSHEIRTPMNGIIGMSSLLLDTKQTSEQERFSQIIKDSGASLLQIINDILDFSKLEAGKMEIDYEPFKLRSVVEGLVEILAPKAVDQGIEFAYLVSPEIPDCLDGDSGRLRQVLINLIGNAIKFTEQGTVSLTIKPLYVNADSTKLRFEIRDTGIGLSEEQIQKLFKSFSQADSSTSRRFGGTGLGLAITKHIVSLLEGEVGVTSVEGEGSTFWLELPFSIVESEKDKAGMLRLGTLSGLNMLVIDDNGINLEVMDAMLGSWGVNVTLASSVDQAIRCCDNQQYAVAFIDYEMPDKDGLEFVKWAKAREPVSGMKLMMVSSIYLDSGPEKDLLDGYLMKPVHQSVLLTKVYDLLGIAPVVLKAKNTPKEVVVEYVVPELKILVVEDNKVNQMLALALLKKFGFTNVDVAINGALGVEAVLGGEYNLVFMDMQMPVMDGLEATRMIRSSASPKSNVLIIAMTANAMEGDRQICIDAGMNDYLSKPLDPKKLESMVMSYFGVKK